MQYTKHLQKHLEANNVQYRIGVLSSACSGRQLNEDETKEYNKIDVCITEGMRAAECNLPRRRERGWTDVIKTLVHQIRYYHLLLGRTRGMHIHETCLKNVWDLAEVKWNGTDEADIKERLQLAWKKLNKHMKHIEERQEKHLQEYANEISCTDQEKSSNK